MSVGKAKTEMAIFGALIPIEFSNLRSVNLLLESGNWLVRLGQTSADTVLVGMPLPKVKDTFSGVGVQYDNGKALIMAEYATRRDTDVNLFDSDSWYVSGGWRFGAWMPYLSLSSMKVTGVVIADPRSETTKAVGLRWDAMPNVAIKTQVQQTQGNLLPFINAAPSFQAERPNVRVVSLALDYVF